MLGFGFGYNRILTKLDDFDPLNIEGLQLYLNKDLGVTLATGSNVFSWQDQSPNGYLLSQSTVTAQPLLSANSIDFDGVNDNLSLSVANVFGGDSSGIAFFSFYWDGVNNFDLLSSADNLVDNRLIDFQCMASLGGIIRILTINGATTNSIASTDSCVVGFNYGWVKSNGTAYEISLNGVIQVVNVLLGSNDGTWYADITGRDNLVIGGVKRLTPFYTPVKSTKIIYSNSPTLTASQIAKIDNFMSQP